MVLPVTCVVIWSYCQSVSLALVVVSVSRIPLSETGAPNGPREALSKTLVAKAPLVKQISSNESHFPMVEATFFHERDPKWNRCRPAAFYVIF